MGRRVGARVGGWVQVPRPLGPPTLLTTYDYDYDDYDGDGDGDGDYDYINN